MPNVAPRGDVRRPVRTLYAPLSRLALIALGGTLLIGPASGQRGTPPKPEVPAMPRGYFDPPGPNQRGWRKAPMSAAQIAKATEARLRGLRGVGAIAQAFYEVNGGRGMGYLTLAAKTPTVFHLEYLTLGGRYDVSRDTMVSDGKRFAMLTRPGWSIPVPLAARRDTRVADPVTAWARSSSRLMFVGIGSKATPWSDLVRAASKPGSGYEVFAEQRSWINAGRPILNYRILVRRNAQSVRKRGRLFVELVVDAQQKLPVTVRTVLEPPGKTPTRVHWLTGWGPPKGGFPADLFRLPATRTKKRVTKRT